MQTVVKVSAGLSGLLCTGRCVGIAGDFPFVPALFLECEFLMPEGAGKGEAGTVCVCVCVCVCVRARARVRVLGAGGGSWKQKGELPLTDPSLCAR